MLTALRYRLEYAAFLLLNTLVRTLPRGLALALGARLGALIPIIQPQRQRQALKNLRLALPQLSEQEARALLRENFRQLGITGVEMLRLDLYHQPQTLERYFAISGLEHLHAARALGRGVFLLTGHLGFWEAGAIVLPMLGIPIDMIYKQMKNPLISRKLIALREAAGGRCIDKGKAARKILRSLAENRPVAVLIDQRVTRREAIRVDFFGRPANTTPIIAQLAIKQGAVVVPSFCRRLPDNRYEIVFEPMLSFAKATNPDAETIHAATQAMTATIEAAIRRTPQQWFWLHDRWRL